MHDAVALCHWDNSSQRIDCYALRLHRRGKSVVTSLQTSRAYPRSRGEGGGNLVNGFTGGEGAIVSVSETVSPGAQLDVVVARNGGDGTPVSDGTFPGGSGGSGYGAGGNGGTTDCAGGCGTPAGGGGGSAVFPSGSGVSTASFLVVAGGGGGEGANGDGGNAGSNGRSNDSFCCRRDCRLNSSGRPRSLHRKSVTGHCCR